MCAIQLQVSYWLQPDLMWFTSIDKQLLHSGACEHRGQHGRCRHRRYCGPCGPTSGMKYRKTLPGCFEMTEKRLWVCAYNEWKKSNITYGGGDKVAAEKTPGRNVQAEYETDSHLNCEHQKKRLETSLRQTTLCCTYFHKLIIVTGIPLCFKGKTRTDSI